MKTPLVLGALAAVLLSCSTASAAWYVGPVTVVTPAQTFYYGPAVAVYQPPLLAPPPPVEIAPAPVVRIVPPPAPVIVRPRAVRRVYYLW